MRVLNRPARLFVAAVACAALLAAAWLYPTFPRQPQTVLYVLVLAGLHHWLGTVRLSLPTGNSYTPGTMVTVTGFLVFGPAVAAAAVALSVGAETYRAGYRRFYDIANTTVSLAAAWGAFGALGGTVGGAQVQGVPGLAGALIYTYANLFLGAAAGAVERGAALFPILRHARPLRIGLWPAIAVLLAPAFARGVWLGFAVLAAVAALAYLYGRDDGQMRLAAERDPVTGLFNHLFLHRRLAELAGESARAQTPLVVVMLDIPGFKAFNDRHGHAAGDRALAGLGALAGRQLAWPNLAARYGGDELVLVLAGPQAETAAAVCRELAERIGGLPAPAPPGLEWGIARAPADGWDKNQLLAAAAQRLYRARNAERMRQEEHLRRVERLSALGQMAAGIVHEVKNPLTAVRGFLQLQGDRLDPETYRLMLSELDRISALTTEFLSLARPGPVPIVAVQARELAGAAARLGGMLAQQFGGRLEVRMPEQMPRVAGHPERLKQVLLNLLKNAFEAAPGGTVVLEAGTADSQFWLSISDSGPGVPPDMAERIFDPFFSTKAAGSGLGLTISHQLVYELGGRLELEQSPGGGARFVVYLPLYPN